MPCFGFIKWWTSFPVNLLDGLWAVYDCIHLRVGRPGFPGLSDLPKVIAEQVTDQWSYPDATVQVTGTTEKKQFNICRGIIVIIRVMA